MYGMLPELSVAVRQLDAAGNDLGLVHGQARDAPEEDSRYATRSSSLWPSSFHSYQGTLRTCEPGDGGGFGGQVAVRFP